MDRRKRPLVVWLVTLQCLSVGCATRLTQPWTTQRSPDPMRPQSQVARVGSRDESLRIMGVDGETCHLGLTTGDKIMIYSGVLLPVYLLGAIDRKANEWMGFRLSPPDLTRYCTETAITPGEHTIAVMLSSVRYGELRGVVDAFSAVWSDTPCELTFRAEAGRDYALRWMRERSAHAWVTDAQTGEELSRCEWRAVATNRGGTGSGPTPIGAEG